MVVVSWLLSELMMRDVTWVQKYWPEKFWNPDHELYTQDLDVTRLLNACGMLHEKLFMVTLTKEEVKEAVEKLTMVQQSVLLAGKPVGVDVSKAYMERNPYRVMKDNVVSGRTDFYSSVRNSDKSAGELAKAIEELKRFKKESGLDKKMLAKAIAADSDLMDAAELVLRMDVLAPKTSASYSSQVELYISTMKQAGKPPLPLTPESIKMFSAVLKAADYGGGNSYLSAVMSWARIAGATITEEVMCERKMCGASLNRGSGDTHQMKPISIGILRRMGDLMEKGKLEPFHVMVFRLSVLGVFFMLRADEVLNLKVSEVIMASGKSGIAEIIIAAGKTNQEGKTVRRRLTCVCDENSKGVFPSCALYDLVSEAEKRCPTRDREKWALSSGRKDKPLGMAGFINGLRDLLKLIGVETTSDSGKNLFGTHSLRRGGAQALARAKWPLHKIQLWGR